ncbi:MAG: hypothetical protein F6J93_30135 [Oscillatoria sp. SIO1A7]|nr:hypothetical protein [Oscillatoria sp. SIO1A7]
MSDIIYPTLDLFLYDLRNGLGENEEEIQENRYHFQKKNPASVWPRLFQRDTGFEVEYLELLAKPKNERFVVDGEPYPLEGYYYPVRLGDTYGLLLDCSVNNLTNPQPAKSFAALREEIETRLQGETASIGQTWMISGILPASSKASSEDATSGDATSGEASSGDASSGEGTLEKNTACPEVEEIAKACYQQLMPDSQWEKELQGKGQLMGATIFELSRYELKLIEDGTTAPTDIQSIQENRHIIIILYPNLELAKKAARFYGDWMRLFYYRHKILWSYGQSRLLKLKLKDYLVTIQGCIKHIRQSRSKELDFKKLRETLASVQETLTPYSIELTYLDFQSRTIDMNSSNYQKRALLLEQKAGSDSNIAFVEQFSDLVKDKYLLQIAKDYDNLSLGFQLLDTSINTLRSRVEVDKAVREGAFRNTISVLGLAISANSAVVIHAKSFLFYKKEERALEHPIGSFLYNRLNVPKESLGGSIVLVLGLGAALIAASIAQIVIRWRRE